MTLITCGIALFYLEMAHGQYLSLGPVKAWAVVCPVLKGLPKHASGILKPSLFHALGRLWTSEKNGEPGTGYVENLLF